MDRVPQRKPLPARTPPHSPPDQGWSRSTTTTAFLPANHHDHAHPAAVSSTNIQASSFPDRFSAGRPVRVSSSWESEDDEPHAHQDHRSNKYERVDATADGGHASEKVRRSHFNLDTIAADCAAVLLPMLMAGVVVSLWHLDGTPYVPGSLDAWRNGINIMATAFPILFASIAGRLISAFSHWKLEKGADIEFLETLMGSRTVGSTIVTIFQLRIVPVATLGLIALWAISPLGAQAFLRMVSTDLRLQNSTVEIIYSGPAAHPQLGLQYTNRNGAFDAFNHIMENIYTALLVSAPTSRSNPVDTWGNIRIPALHYDGGSPGDEWREVRRGNSTEYVSLLGIPVNATFPAGNTSFTMESSHLTLKCSEGNSTELTDPTVQAVELYAIEVGSHDDLPPNGTWAGACEGNLTDFKCNQTSTWSLALDRFIDKSWHSRLTPPNFENMAPSVMFADAADVEAGETRLLLQVRIPGFKTSGADQFTATCKLTQTYVESRVNCTRLEEAVTGPDCAVTAQRLSEQPHPSGNISFLSFPLAFHELAARLPRLLKEFEEGRGSRDLSMQYLADPSKFTHGIPGNFLHVTGAELSLRLAQLLNTFIGSSQQIVSAVEGMTGVRGSKLSDEQLVQADSQRFEEYIRLSRAWNATCLASCLVLLFSGLASVVFTHLAKGPDMLGYVSSSVRDSRFVEMAPAVRRLDGPDLTRRLKGRRIRAGIVGGVQGEVGMSPGIGDEANVARI